MSHIEVIALRSFPWSEDGYTTKHAEAKQVFDLPERLFDGLNKAGFVRRHIIGDGHVSLRATDEDAPVAPPPVVAPEAPLDGAATIQALNAPPLLGPGEPPNTLSDILVGESEANAPATAIDDAAEAPAAETGTKASSDAAPSPASATAPLKPEEIEALKDGSWKDWKFFKKQSVAARVSVLPIKNGDDVATALEAEALRLVS